MLCLSGPKCRFAGFRLTVPELVLLAFAALPILSACSERRPPPALSPDSGAPPSGPRSSTATPSRPTGSDATVSQPSPSDETPPSDTMATVDPPHDPARLEGGLFDDSLPEKEYVRAGLPPPDRPWSGADMAKAVQVLSSFADKDPKLLPRYGSKRSGAVFARIVSEDSLRPFRDSSQPLARRVPDALMWMQSSNEILKLYTKAALRVPGNGSEIVELQGSHLRCAALQILLVRELLPQLDRNDPQYSARIDAVEGIKGSLAATLQGTISTLTDRSLHTRAARRRLIAHMLETIPSILPELDRPAQKNVLDRLRTLDEDPSWSELQPELGELTFASTQAVEAEGVR